MITLSEKQKEKIDEWTLKCFPEEACGCITIDDFIPFENVALNRKASFKIDQMAYRQIKDDVIAIYHSHIREKDVDYQRLEMYDARTPSLADVTSCNALGKPYLIAVSDGEGVSPCLEYPRNKDAQLHGREFAFYVNDCLTLMIDYYYQKYGIIIQEHDTKWDWHNNLNEPYYEEHYRDWGFYEVQRNEVEVGDVLLMSIRGTANHLGVVIEENKILHHMVSQPSSEMSLAKLESFIYKFIRHKDKPKC
jgi:proteasome lid subunit RPN8/RPN11